MERSFNGDLLEVARDLKESKYSASIQLPYSANPTFHGSLITISHTLIVEVKTGDCIDDPQISIPIQAGPARTNETSTSNEQQSEEPEIVFDFDHATTAETVYVPSNVAQLGGAAHDYPETEEEIEIEPEIQVAPTAAAPRAASVENLLQEMKESVQDFSLIKKFLELDEWRSVLSAISSEQYGQIVKQVDLDFDQPKVAEEIAKVVSNFTCDHVAAAVTNCSEWNKATIVEKLLPHVNDLAQNKEKILSRLSDWDRTVTERAFRSALGEKG